MSVKNSRFWLAIRCVDLPLSALKLDDSLTRPIVVSENKSVIFANALAKDAGACEGMDISTAQFVTGVSVVDRDKTKEQQVLHELSELLYQFTPYIDRYSSTEAAASGVLLELSSCLKLFSGLRSITEKITASLSRYPYQFTLGLAHSAKAAWLLSFANYPVSGDETQALFIERLNALPIGVLCDYPTAMDLLVKTGFRYLGDIARQIQSGSLRSFKKRLGLEFTELLCDIYDIDQNFQQDSLFQKPRDIYQPDEWFEQEVQFEYPVTVVDQLKPTIESLLQQLCDYLRKRQQQCQYIEWRMIDIYQRKETLKVNSDTPQSYWQLLYDLSLIQFETKTLPFEVDRIQLICRHGLLLPHHNQLLDFNQNRKQKTSLSDFAVTIAKLKARLGEESVYKLSYHDSRVPELTNVLVALAEKSNQILPEIYQDALRPTWLLPKPEPIAMHHQRLFWHGYLFLLVGPERIIGNWWNEPLARDYYLARRHDNVHVWIFFNLYDKCWYLQGVFA